MEVHSTLPNGDACCELVFRDANLNLWKLLSLGCKWAIDPGRKGVMPWDYHTGHLYKTVSEVVVEKLGQAGQEAVDMALTDFARRVVAEAAGTVTAHQDTGFMRLPG